ncbi:MAG: HNH endonuclease [Chlamydiia bacterium]|nr:HNH endonuclease [Chlamydiia bacterium]
MPKLVDLTGMTFGRLYVVGRAKDYVSPKGKHVTMWDCICSCKGKNSIKAIRGSNLVNGTTTSCGCYNRERSIEVNLKDLVGKRFGRLTVVSRTENKGNLTCWNCICDCNCGNSVKVVVRGASLVSGNTTSCGCVQKERASEANFIDLVGQKFGRLTVISRAENKGNVTYWNCICDCNCGNEVKVVVQGGSLINGNTKSCGCYARERASEIHSGSNSYFWKGGVTSLQDAIRNSAKYKEWRKAVFERDNYTCQYSGIVGGRLVVHHIKPFAQILEDNSITTKEEALECLELWDVSNGITLAEEYHSISSSNLESFHLIYSMHSTEQNFRDWFITKLERKIN